MKVAILGFDREGRATFEFLKKNPRFNGAEITILDRNPRVKLPHGVRAVLGPRYLSKLTDFDVIFRTPGVPYLLPAIQRAKKRGVMIESATKLFFEETARMRPRPIIVGVTGTKGKGTTSTLLYKILKASRKNAYLAGNVGIPALTILPKLKKGSIVVLELSSFQLQDLARSPQIAVVLDMFPDHLDAHKNLKEYYAAKANVSKFQTKNDLVFFTARNPWTAWAARHGKGTKIKVDERTFHLFGQKELALPGPHNFKNAVMAATVAKRLGVPVRTIVRTVKKFTGTEHRLELVRTLQSIPFYNDSAATNPMTTAAAIASFPGKDVILIACGRPKVRDHRPVTAAAKQAGLRKAVLLGENVHMMHRALKKAGVVSVRVRTLEAAVMKAYMLAKAYRQAIVLFSPGGTSFDMFKNYAERGVVFKKIVARLKA